MPRANIKMAETVDTKHAVKQPGKQHNLINTVVTKGSAAEKGAVFSCLILVPSVYFLIKEILGLINRRSK